MIKKVLCLLSITLLLGILSACGSATNTTAEVTNNTTTVETATEEEASAEEIAEPTPEPTQEPEDSIEPEEASEETEDAKEPFTELTEEYAVEKVQRAQDAWLDLLERNGAKPYESYIACAVFTYQTPDESEIKDIKTLDGKGITYYDFEDPGVNSLAFNIDMFSNYFDNYINRDGEYYDFEEYVSSHNRGDIGKMLLGCANDLGGLEAVSENDVCCLNCTYLPSFNGEMTLQNITNEITVEHNKVYTFDQKWKDVAWQCDIYTDGKDTGIKAVFDADGNFLNFNDENSKIEKVIPFT